MRLRLTAYTLPVQKKQSSFRFKSANCSVMIWGCFSCSGQTTASQQSSRMYWMTRLSFLSSLMARAYSRTTVSRSSCERVEHEDTWLSGSMRSHFHTWIGHHRVLTLTPLKVFGVKGKDGRNVSTLLSSIQNLGQKWMQLRMEINVVTLHKVVETMPQQMLSIIKAKAVFC